MNLPMKTAAAARRAKTCADRAAGKREVGQVDHDDSLTVVRVTIDKHVGQALRDQAKRERRALGAVVEDALRQALDVGSVPA